MVPPQHLSPSVSGFQTARKELQHRIANGWNHWSRHSALAYVSLPQNVGIDIGVRNRKMGSVGDTEYRGGLVTVQLPSKSRGAPV